MDIYRKCVFLKLLSAPLCERILNDSGGVVKFTDANDTYDIKVTWADTHIVTVKLHVIPMELSDTAIKDVMTQYGTVYNIRDEVYNSEHTYPVRTERKLLLMEVKRPIPSYVMIQH